MSANLATSSPLRTLACAIGIMAAWVPAGSAAQPAADGEHEVVHVEIWHGLRRVDQEKKKAQEVSQPSPKSPDSSPDSSDGEKKSEASAEDVLPAGWPGGIGRGLPFVQWTVPGIAGPKDFQPVQPASWLEELAAPLSPHRDLPEKALAQPEPGREMKQEVAAPKEKVSKETKPLRSGELSETQEAVAPVVPGSADVRTEHGADSASEDVLSKILIQVAFIFAVAIVAPLVSITSFFWLLRRHSRHFGPLFRIDYVGNAPVVTGPFSANALGLAGQEAFAPALDRGGRFEDLQAAAPGGHAEEEIAEQFEVGPTFEEERLLIEGRAKNQEAAVLQHLFEENLRLHEQIEHGVEREEEATGEDAG